MNWSDLRPCCCVLGLALAGTAAQAQPAGPAAASTQHATRSGAAFSDLEEALLRAQRDRRSDTLGQQLSDDFLMIVAMEGGAAVPREDWLDAAIKPGAGAWVVSQLASQDYGNVAVVSFVLRPSPARAGAVPLAVVDTWTRAAPAGETWRLAMRHVAHASGPRKGVPGDAPTREVIKKF